MPVACELAAVANEEPSSESARAAVEITGPMYEPPAAPLNDFLGVLVVFSAMRLPLVTSGL